MVEHDRRACDRVRLNALGVSVTVTVRGAAAPRVSTLAHQAWSRCLRDAPDSPTTAHVEVDANDDEAVSLAALSTRVTTAAIGARAGDLLMLHAAAVADPATGRAIALVGPSGTGKTTAARELGSRLGYLTDETAGIDDGGVVVPYAKPLSLLEHGAGPKRQVSPDELNLVRAPRACRLAGIVVLDRGGVWTTEVESVPTVMALAVLAPETSYLSRLHRPLQRIADLLDATGGLHRIRYREAADLLAPVTRLLGAT